MRDQTHVFLKFLIAGTASGIFTGMSLAVAKVGLFFPAPVGLISPGVVFGFCISQAVHRSLTVLSFRQRLALIVASTVAWFIAIVVSALSVGITGFDNGYIGAARYAAFGGGAGAFVVAFALIVVIDDLKPLTSLVVITLTGAILGSLFLVVAVYIADQTSLGHPFDVVVAYSIWQAGVASIIPTCHYRLKGSSCRSDIA